MAIGDAPYQKTSKHPKWIKIKTRLFITNPDIEALKREKLN
jgi:hypothetical protein